MTVDEAIRHLYTYSSTNGSGQTTQDQHEEAKLMAIKALKAQQWIPCSERLPEEGVEVLCCFRNGDNYKIIVSKRTDFNYWSSVGRIGDTIAWMPLPEPWEGEEHERMDV